MPEMDGTYTYVALPWEERARLIRAEMEKIERDFFNAQIAQTLNIAMLPADATAEQKAEARAERTRQVTEHKKRLVAAAKILDEVMASQPAAPAEPTA